MKRVLKVVLIASVVMMALLIGGMVYLSQVRSRRDADNQQEENKELDILLDDVEKVSFTDDDEIIPLYLTGKNKNVMTFDDKPLSEVYTTGHTKQIDKKLRIEKKRGSRRIDNALWAWNPYGTQPMSLYMYFLTRENCSMTYTVSVLDEKIPDFTRTLNNHQEGNVTDVQEYSIIGLIPGKKNYITLRVYGADGKEKKEMIYSIDAPKLPEDIDAQISMTKGYNHTLLSNGLYLVYGNHKNKKDGSYILFCDNSGYLRSYLPLKADAASNVEEIDGCLFFPCSKDQFVLMSPSGQVRKVYSIKGYELYGGFAYDGASDIYALADIAGGKSVHDKILQIGLKEGQIEKIIDMGSLLPKAKAKAKKNSKGKKSLNWLDLNSIQYIDSSTLLLSARELSSVIILKNIQKSRPSLKSILGEDILWYGTGLKKKIAEKAGSFNAQFGQTCVISGDSGEYVDLTPELDEEGNVIESEEAVPTKQYYICMFNSNYGDSKTVSVNYRSFGAGTKKKKAAASYYYQYRYDEGENVYSLVTSMELPYSPEGGSVQLCDGNPIIGNQKEKAFMEYTPDGKMLHTYDTEFRFRKVEKKNMKQFWFV